MTTQSQDRLIGKHLDEYRVDSLLGQGNMARIYLATDVRLKRKVAIKVIETAYQNDPEYVKRFEREARAIAQLEHPHIVRLYRYGEAHGVLYMAMQYIEGASLETVLASYKADGEFMEAQEASRIVREICMALDYAHGEGVIHRDVKPPNILLNKAGRAILADFGLVLIRSDGTRGEIFGTPHYMSPEQALSSAKAVPQSDLYSMGVILYEIFTGERPFDAPRPLDVALQHMTRPPRPPRELRPAISAEVEAVILKALAKAPEDRYQSGAELADALEAALKVGAAAKPKTTRRRKKATAAAKKTGSASAKKPSVSGKKTAAEVTEVETLIKEPKSPASGKRTRRRTSSSAAEKTSAKKKPAAPKRRASTRKKSTTPPEQDTAGKPKAAEAPKRRTGRRRKADSSAEESES